MIEEAVKLKNAQLNCMVQRGIFCLNLEIFASRYFCVKKLSRQGILSDQVVIIVPEPATAERPGNHV